MAKRTVNLDIDPSGGVRWLMLVAMLPMPRSQRKSLCSSKPNQSDEQRKVSGGQAALSYANMNDFTCPKKESQD
jgi:hypothetical protein